MTTDTAATTFQFQGFQHPTTTPVPDEVFDVLAPQLTEAELRVLLYIIRRTFGFKKQKDPISLTQLVEGIKTKDGNVLDRGTGMSRRGVMKGCQGLVKKGVITVEKRLSEQGDYAVNVYSVRVQDERGVGNVVPYGREQSTLPVGNKVALQQTVIQETEKQETDVVVDVTKELENFGIAKAAAAKLTKQYPAPHIREKLAMAKNLVATGSALVSQNPAGWLRRAIEEDYSLPRSKKRHRHHNSRKKKGKPAPRVPQIPVKECQQGHTVPAAQREPENSNSTTPEEKKALDATWEKVVAHLTRDLPQEEVTARLAGTALVAVTDTVARIGVTNPTAVVWLERRLYGQIAKTMKGVLGRDVDLQFIGAS
jgi:hypothetical protein